MLSAKLEKPGIAPQPAADPWAAVLKQGRTEPSTSSVSRGSPASGVAASLESWSGVLCLVSDDTPSTSTPKPKRQRCDSPKCVLSLETVELVHGGHKDSAQKVHKREVKGSDPACIMSRLDECHSHCTCKKARLCYKTLSFSECKRFCTGYWGLTDQQRQFLIHTMYFASETDDTDVDFKQRRSWHWGGKRICFAAFCWLLGTSQPTLRKYLGWSQSGRPCTGSGNHLLPRDEPQRRKVDWFFMAMYK